MRGRGRRRGSRGRSSYRRARHREGTGPPPRLRSRASIRQRRRSCTLSPRLESLRSRRREERKGCPEVVGKEKSPTFQQVRGLNGAVSRYSHSFTYVCRGIISVASSLPFGLDRNTAESCRVASRRRLGQIRELFRNREPTVSFLSRGQKQQGFEVRNRLKGMPKRLFSLFGACLTK